MFLISICYYKFQNTFDNKIFNVSIIFNKTEVFELQFTITITIIIIYILVIYINTKHDTLLFIIAEYLL